MKRVSQHTKWVVGGGAVVTAVIIVLAFWQGDFLLGAKSTTAGAIISQGEKYEVAYTTSAKVPSVKIEICRGTKCQALAAKATGRKTKVTVPKNYTLGAAFFKVMERNTAGALTGKIQRSIPIVVIAAANEEKEPDDSDTKNTASGSMIGGNAPISARLTPTPEAKPPVIAYKLKHVCIQERSGEIGRSLQVEWEPKTAILGYRLGNGDLSAKPWWYPSTNLGATIIPLLNGYYAQIPIYGYPTLEIQLKPAATIWRDSGGSEIYRFDAGPEPLIVAGAPIPPGAKLPPRVTPSPARRCLYTNS
ncbi:MAG: hypothetical protein HYZ63_02590 [Candidatus Andersenbacteria bacterium]|nr:hypothetical protein [Candidatus Andersenbacteria bacterium]